MLLHLFIKNIIMKKQITDEEVKPDLKHDTMEFSAATDGDDIMDTDDETYEEEDISADELDVLEDEPDNEAAALDAAETDREADEDNLPEEDWTDDIEEDTEDENENLPEERVL